MKNFKKILATLFVLVMIVLTLTSCNSEFGPSTTNNSRITASNTIDSSQPAASSSDSSQTSSEATQQSSSTPVDTNVPAQNPLSNSLFSLGFPVLLLVGMYFLLIAPQRKKEKKAKEMRDQLKVGDEIVTIGGIVGRIVMIKDQDQIILETGSDKSKIKLMRWAIQQSLTVSDK